LISGWPNFAVSDAMRNVQAIRELAPATERKAVHGRNHGLAEPLDPIEYALAAPRVLAAAHRCLHRQLVDVGAGDE
jgi:hypothetical protein